MVYVFKVPVPDHDCDFTLVFPSGREILIQCRPSNADDGYNGSLDIVLPEDMPVVNWAGDNMQPAPQCAQECERLAKQLVMELP